MCLSRAFIWLVTPLGFVWQIRIWNFSQIRGLWAVKALHFSFPQQDITCFLHLLKQLDNLFLHIHCFNKYSNQGQQEHTTKNKYVKVLADKWCACWNAKEQLVLDLKQVTFLVLVFILILLIFHFLQFHLEKKNSSTHLTCSTVDPFNNDIIRKKALKSVSFVLNKFSQMACIEPKLTTYWHKRGE